MKQHSESRLPATTPLKPSLAALFMAAAIALAGCGGGGGGGAVPTPPPTASNWRTLASLGAPRQESGVALLNGEIYFVGGFNAASDIVADVDVYNPGTDTWRKVASLPRPLHHPNVSAAGGRLYVVGALSGLNFSADGATLQYDPASNTWTQKAPLPAGSERGAAAVGTLGNLIYVAGGLRSGASVTDFSAYDTSTDTWTGLARMTTSRDHLVGAVVGNRFFAIGGRSGSALRAQVEIFDPAAGTWSAGQPMPTPRGGCMGAAVDGRIVIVGGEGNAATASGVFDQSELYDPTSNTWSTLERMRTPRHGSGAAGLNGSLYVPGGATVQGFGAVATSEALKL